MKFLKLTYFGKDYKLEFSRTSAKMFEDMGFTPSDLFTKPNSSVIPFVYCAFKANHTTMTMKKAEEIYSEIPANQKTEFISALTAMYTDTYTSLLGDEKGSDEGNAKWEPNWSDESE